MIRLLFLPSFITGVKADAQQVDCRFLAGQFLVVPCQCGREPELFEMETASGQAVKQKVMFGRCEVRRRTFRFVPTNDTWQRAALYFVVFYGQCGCGKTYFDCYSVPPPQLHGD